ncbi:NADH-cytochrome b5 reductase-like protein [Nymphaea colorata]|nr:NADH-cytochrome b5 reductase-like protein [Nymphaea colorata]
MASLLSRRLATIAPAALRSSFRAAATSHFTTSASSSSSSSSANHRRLSFPFGIFAAACGGTAYFYSYGSTGQVLLDQQPDETARDVALNPEKWIKFELQEKVSVNHNTYLFRFHFDPPVKLGLDVASCILTRAPIGNDAEGSVKYVIRPYTPISDPDAKGYFDLLVKVYPEGKMSKHLASLEPGDLVEVKGPIEKLRYSPNMKRHIGMIAGGTGITPMLQIIEAILKDPADNTQVSLIYANISPDDILLKRKLDVLSASHPNFKVFYTVDNPSKNWRGGTGYISKEMILKGLPCPSDDTLILVCGPPGMMKHISGDKAKDRSQGELSGLLKELGYTQEMVYKF